MPLCRVSAIALLVLTLALPARADEVVDSDFPVQLFEPAMGLDAYFGVEGPQVSEHLGFTLGLTLNYQHRPLVLYFENRPGVSTDEINLDNAQDIALVESMLTADVMGTFAIRYKWLRAQIGLGLPVHLLMTGVDVNSLGEGVADYIAFNSGELKLELKLMLFEDLAGFSLTFAPVLGLPTGIAVNNGSSDLPTGRPRLLLGYRRGDFSAALNVGYLFRKNSTLFSSEVGDQLLYSLGAAYKVHERVTLMAEVFGRAGFGTESGCRYDPTTATRVCSGTSNADMDAYPLEVLAGLRIPLTFGLDLQAGAGAGIIRAIGSPTFRVLAGLRWAPDFRDTDGDGVYDRVDQCPTQPEDRDGFQDQDGCPDPDNDADLIPDVRDRCPDAAEDMDTFKDEDGCPEDDNDGDGIKDINDACPLQPETKNGFSDEDGCPDIPDQDGDGVEDAADKCPKEQEDKDQFEDQDGCPDVDNDGDGAPDQFDDCPNAAEDTDNFEDDNGCPDPDNDKDGVLDGVDKCPDQPETINGFKDDDGCPDKGESHVVLQADRIVITQKVFFDTGKATIQKKSHPLLGEVALVLIAHPQVKKVRIEGHTDDRGEAKANRLLSQQRAEAVRDFLVQKGVEKNRLEAQGYGQEKPLASNRTEKGREQNRRVEFMIVADIPPETERTPAGSKPEGTGDTSE